MNLTRISILKIDLAIIFCEVSVYAEEMRVGKIFDIAISNCRSFPGFQMMGLCDRTAEIEPVFSFRVCV